MVSSKTEEELRNTCLSVSIELTGSQYGFIGEVGLDGRLQDIAFSDMGWEKRLMYDKEGYRCPPENFALHGFYGYVINSGKGFFTNDPQSHPSGISLPFGHPPLSSFLGIPLLEEGKIVGMLGVANREGGYSYEQIEDIEAVAASMIQAIKRKKTEEMLLDAKEQIKTQSDELLRQLHELQVQNKELIAQTKELNKAYDALCKSEEHILIANRVANIGIYSYDFISGEGYWSPELKSHWGVKPDDSIALDNDLLIQCLHPEDRQMFLEAINKANDPKSNGVLHLEYRVKQPDGSDRWLLVNGQTYFVGEGTERRPYRAYGATVDITDRKQAEKGKEQQHKILEEQWLQLQAIIQVLPVGVSVFNLNGDSLISNAIMSHYMPSKIPSRELNGMQQWRVFDKEYQELPPVQWPGARALRGETVIPGLECIFTDNNGQENWIQVSAIPLRSPEGEIIGGISVASDITKIKKTEEALKKAHEILEEKVKERTEELEKAYIYLKEIETVRKQEIHHRIKNNLQVISSLLDLQAEKFRGMKNIKDPQILEAFKESQNRIISMALIHEELHKGGQIDTLNVSHYIKELADNLLLTYRVGTNGIILDTDIEEDIFFDMDTSVPLGIIINELVPNSLKHAFPDGNNGEIRIKLQRKDNGDCKVEGNKSTNYFLSVTDNGVGIPEDLGIEDLDNLGLQLVTTLVQQLDGELELKRNNGTEIIIRFVVIETYNHESVKKITFS